MERTYRIEIRQFNCTLLSLATSSNVEREIDEYESGLIEQLAKVLSDAGRMESGYYQAVLLDDNDAEFDSQDLMV